MTESKTDTNNNNNSDYLFENSFAYVNKEGEVFLKENKFYKERAVVTVEPDVVDEQVEKLQNAFTSIESKFDKLIKNAEAQTEDQLKEFKEKLDSLKKEASEFEAIGDYEKLVESANQTFEGLKKKVKKSTEKEEGTTEAVDTSATEPEEPETNDDAKVEEETKKPVEDTKKEPDEDDGIQDDEEAEEPTKEPVEESEESPEELTAGTETPEETEEDEKDSEEQEATPEQYYKELAEKAETLVELSDWSYATIEFENLDIQWEEGPDPEEADIKQYREKIDTLREQLEEKKKAHYEEQKQLRQQNLEKKKDLLNQLNEIVEEEKWTHTREVGKIKNRWDSIKPVPAEENEKLESAYKKNLSIFDEHKVDRIVRKKQKEEDNLTGKLVILEKMEKFLNSVDKDSDWKDLDKKISDYTKQFRKIGRVPIEKNQDVWDRFHRAQDTFHSMRFKYDKQYRKDIEKFLSRKKQLIDEAEALVDAENLAKAARKVNKLHRKWKKVGNLPQKDENELWDRFKAATDAFNEKKGNNIDVLREQEEKNYEKKLNIIDKANELKDSEDWEKTHNEYQRLMDSWKDIGPVPRKKSGKIWKKFKGAMDHFYDRRRDFFKEVKEERKDNLKEKEDILDKLKALKSHENPIEAVNQAKPLQEEFKKAGYVPIKHKNRMWKEYRETCDVIYDRFRAAKSAAQVVGKENIDNFSTDDIADIRKKQKEAEKLRKEINKLSGELLQMKESLSYFKPSKGSSLLDDVKKKIDKAEEKISDKEDKLQDLEIEIDKIKRGN